MSATLMSLIAFVGLLLSSPALAGDVIKDPSAAFACRKNGRTLLLYSPFGRAPTISERGQCARLGGSIVRPEAPILRAPTQTSRPAS